MGAFPSVEIGMSIIGWRPPASGSNCKTARCRLRALCEGDQIQSVKVSRLAHTLYPALFV